MIIALKTQIMPIGLRGEKNFHILQLSSPKKCRLAINREPTF